MGETPAEDAAQPLIEVSEVLGTLDLLIQRINRTNAAVEMSEAARSATRSRAGVCCGCATQ